MPAALASSSCVCQRCSRIWRIACPRAGSVGSRGGIDMLAENVLPGRLVELDEMALRIAGLRDDVALGHRPRLGLIADARRDSFGARCSRTAHETAHASSNPA